MIDEIVEAEKTAFLSLVETLTEEDEVKPDDSDVNQDLYEIGTLGNEATIDDIVFKLNEVIMYINRNLGV